VSGRKAENVSVCTSRASNVPGVSSGIKKTESFNGENESALVPKPGADFEIVEREIPNPTAGHVRIRVQACGICHSDSLVKEGYWPGIQYPRSPGHEVTGVIDDVGSGVTGWKKGQRGRRRLARRPRTALASRAAAETSPIAQPENLRNQLRWRLSRIHDRSRGKRLPQCRRSLDAAEAGPLLCAGVTTFNALRHSGAMPSDLVAVQGIGGLGHLGIQFASKFGYKVAAVGRGSQKAALAKKTRRRTPTLTAKATNAAEELQKLGGARVILATATDSKSMSDLVGGLGLNGTLLVVARDRPD